MQRLLAQVVLWALVSLQSCVETALPYLLPFNSIVPPNLWTTISVGTPPQSFVFRIDVLAATTYVLDNAIQDGNCCPSTGRSVSGRRQMKSASMEGSVADFGPRQKSWSPFGTYLHSLPFDFSLLQVHLLFALLRPLGRDKPSTRAMQLLLQQSPLDDIREKRVRTTALRRIHRYRHVHGALRSS